MTELDPQGVTHEADFWRRFVQSERFLQGWCGNFPTPELDHRVLGLVQSLPPGSRVLDVGSGPVSLLHGANPHIMVLTADPLSPHYQSMVDFLALQIPAPLTYAAEDLPEEWQGLFDVVHISNALDHTVDPFAALQRLEKCVKLGGLLIVQGFVNEADHEHQAGFHQHNLYLDHGNLCISSPPQEIVTRVPPAWSGISILNLTDRKGDRDWFIWAVCKTKAVE